MNSFDAVIYVGLIVAVVTGFNAGLLRSAVTILAYLFAMPIALWAMSMVSPAVAGKLDSPWAQNSVLFFAIFLAAGIVLGKIARMAALFDAIGTETGILDRLAGAVLGAVRAGLVAITLVLIFDQLVPADRQSAFPTACICDCPVDRRAKGAPKSLPPGCDAHIELAEERPADSRGRAIPAGPADTGRSAEMLPAARRR